MKTIAIANHKGGVGKTTTAVNISYGLAKVGKKVLLIDLDHQAHTTRIYVNENEDLKDNYVGRLFTLPACITDVLRKSYVCNTPVDNLDIIPSYIDLALIAEEVTSKLHREKILFKQLQYVYDNYDYCIIDCAPALSALTINAIYAADKIIIPTTYSDFSLSGISGLFNSIANIKEMAAYDYKILRNQKDERKTKVNDYIERELKGLDCFNTVIRTDEKINQSQILKQPVQLFAPDSKAAADYIDLVREVVDG